MTVWNSHYTSAISALLSAAAAALAAAAIARAAANVGLSKRYPYVIVVELLSNMKH